MDLVRAPSYSLVQGIDGTNDLRGAALSELVGIHAGQTSICGVLSTFEYTECYDALVKAITRRLPSHLRQWGNFYSQSTSGPMTQAAALRLEEKCSLWTAADTVVVMAPITSTPLRAELLGRDGTVVPIGVEPADLVILNDSGLRVPGGHFRFIMMSWVADPRPNPMRNYHYTRPVIHNLPAHGWIALGPP